MQAKDLTAATGCPEATRKAWEKDGVIVPAMPSGGRGVPATYDDANLVAVAVALEMRALHVTVGHFGGAFADLHEWLRSIPPAEWRTRGLIMRPDHADVLTGPQRPEAASGVYLRLDAVLSTRLPHFVPGPSQLSLFPWGGGR
jgi:hypothetical protein